MATKKKVEVKEAKQELPEFFNNPEFGTAADKLIAAIKHYYSAIEGKTATNDEVTRIATEIVRRRA